MAPGSLLPEENLADELAEQLVGEVQVGADDDARDDDHHGGLDHLVLAGPLDLAELADRLADEPREAAARDLPRRASDRLHGRTDRRLSVARTPCRRRALARLAPRPPLSSRLPSHLLARLPVHRMATAPAAVLLQLDSVGRVPLRL